MVLSMIDLNKFDEITESDIRQCVIVFNNSFKEKPKETLAKTYYQLWELDKAIDLYTWRAFYTDARVQKFYEKEFTLSLNAKKQALLQQMGENKSVATNQALTSILKYLEVEEVDPNDNKIFIYSFIPLNEQERNAKNVRILNNIPENLKDAIQIIEGDSESKKG